MVRNLFGTAVGKTIQVSVKVRRGGGHALPGLVVDKILPGYIASMLSRLSEGVVLITGTNGKTTTTKIVADLLRANGKRVMTNPTGSNMTRGIASGLIQSAKLTGRLPYDIAVLEVDEAYAQIIAQKVTPRWVLALNVGRDQLDRFGEVDSVAKLISAAVELASEGAVVNADDPYLVKAVETFMSDGIKYFGVSAGLRQYFPDDYQLAAVGKPAEKFVPPAKDVELVAFKGQSAEYKIGENIYKCKLNLRGQHNFQNAAAALLLAKQLLPTVPDEKLVKALGNIALAFGRGEIYKLPGGRTVELVLVKNPSGFRQALASYADKSAAKMIAINDNIADGRDVSWLWDVGFTSLGNKIAMTSGSRAADMALRLSYDQVAVADIEPRVRKALVHFLAKPAKRRIIFATYTAMLALHKDLTKLSGVAR